MSFAVSFPGGLRVEAAFGGHIVPTDQPALFGGTDSAPAPFDLFLASLATCAGFYALRFCQQRKISTDGLALTLTPVRDPQGQGLAVIRMEVRTPPGFPEKYEDAIVRAIDHCAVKRAILEPPRFETVVIAANAPAPS